MLEDKDKKEIMKMIDLSSRRDFSRRIGDTPTDALQLMPKKTTWQVFTTDARPASVRGQLTVQFFNVTDGMPWWYNPSSSVWGDATGSVVASN